MVRVLLCGDLKGRLRLLCDQVVKLHGKLSKDQQFEAVFCVGEFSTEDMELDVEPPIPIHFIDCGPAVGDLIAKTPQGGEVQPGVHFLGHYGVSRIAGLTVAFLSGRLRADLFSPADTGAATAKDQANAPSWEDIRAAEKLAEVGRQELFVDGCHYTPLAVERLREEITDAGGVDLLLTCEWPTGCLRGVPKEARQEVDKATVQQSSSPAVAEIAALAEPKYHAVGLGSIFWRRPPWTHVNRGEVVAATGELRCGVCRMIALGAVDGPGQASSRAKPQKWLHGLDLDPKALPASAADATPSPWAAKPEAEPSPGGAGGAAELARPVFERGDSEEQRRWLQRFGVLPNELLKASDKVEREAQPREKKEKRESIYWNQKSDKRFKAGKGGHEAFHQKERRAANGKSAGSFF